MTIPEFQTSTRGVVRSGGTTAFAIVPEDQAVLGTADVDGILQQSLEDALEVEHRPADGLEHLGRGCLLPQRLAKLLGACLHLVEQPHVLDGDHRLVGEGLDQFDLLVGKWSDDSAEQVEHTNRSSFAQQRHSEDCAKAASPLSFTHGVLRVG